MLDLLKATKTRFEGDATLAALGTLYSNHSPPGTDPPFAVQSPVASGVTGPPASVTRLPVRP